MTAGVPALAVGTGVALDQFVLQDLRSGQITSSDGAAPRPSGINSEALPDVRPGTNGGARKVPDGVTAPTAVTQTPPPKTRRLPPRRSARRSTPTPAPSTKAAGTPAPIQTTAAPGAEATVVLLTNAERVKAGCSPLLLDQRLVTAARQHSADMAANNYFGHNSQNGDTPWTRMEAAGYPNPGAENIAEGFATPTDVVAGWMKSAGHRANILNCDLTTIGVGMATGSRGPLWTQDFGLN